MTSPALDLGPCAACCRRPAEGLTVQGWPSCAVCVSQGFGWSAGWPRVEPPAPGQPVAVQSEPRPAEGLEECPKCGRASLAGHRAICTGPTPGQLRQGRWTARARVPDELPARVPEDHEVFDDVPDPETGRYRESAERLRAPRASGQDALSGSGRGVGPSGAPQRARGARRKPVPWAPLAPALPDTAWRVTVDLELRTLSPNRLHAEHWKSRSRRRAREHKAVREALESASLPPLDRGVIVTLVRVGPALVDTDRLAGSLYAVRDALADLLTGGDDSPRETRVAWRYAQHREVIREAHRYPARPSRPADPARGLPERPGRPARLAWRYRSWVRVVVETSNEVTSSRCDRRCDEAEDVRCSGVH
jgi:hypothetical protein